MIVLTLCCSASDGKYLISGSENKTIKIWNIVGTNINLDDNKLSNNNEIIQLVKTLTSHTGKIIINFEN